MRCCGDGYSKLSKMAACRQLGFDVTGNSATRFADPENAITKHEVYRITRCGDYMALRVSWGIIYGTPIFSRRTNGRAYATVLRLSSVCLSSVCPSVTLCIVAKRCVLEQKLLLRAYRI